MIRISLQYIWLLSEQLEGFGRLTVPKDAESRTIFDFVVETAEPNSALRTLLRESVFATTLRSSRPLGAELYALVEQKTEQENWTQYVKPYEVVAVKSAYNRFKVALLAELGTLPAYFVTQKGSHDTLTLLDIPELMFPADLQAKVPEAMFDVAEAGKALCYEVPTACGFHLFRATEAVLRKYYHHSTGGMAPPKMRNIMVYVQAIRGAKCGDETILSVIEQLAKLHRNPLIHPEVALNLDEAISIYGMARSAVTAMLRALPTPAPTTTAPQAATP